MQKKVFLLIVSLLLISAGHAAAKPAPPKDLLPTFKEIQEFEEALEHKEWYKASKQINEINERFSALVPELKMNTPEQLLFQWSGIVNNLKQSLSAKNFELSVKTYVFLQNLLLKIVDHYEYALPPVFPLMDKYLGEAMEALKEKEYEEVMREMEEVISFMALAEPHLKGKNASAAEISDFKRTLISVRDAAGVKNYNKSLDGLKKLKNMSGGFLEAL